MDSRIQYLHKKIEATRKRLQDLEHELQKAELEAKVSVQVENAVMGQQFRDGGSTDAFMQGTSLLR